MRGTQSGSNMIVFSSDGSGGHSSIQGIHLEFDDTRVSSESLVSVECQDTDIEMNFLAISNTVLGDGPNEAGHLSVRSSTAYSGHALLFIQSLKGGNGLKENSSLWFLNLGCSLSGIASERVSPFFIPQLASVESHQQGSNLAIDLAGSLLLPCGLALHVDLFDGSVHNLQSYPLQAEEFAGETEIHTAIPASIVTTASEATSVREDLIWKV
ncbi:uncharacterized protein MONOS_12359 [Monocercomonoides exilis]|uniref:uncharacterized protein n=1 Tax=Monocercomonoides exilis TaxID=2049356 RepID=UPI00355A75BF|nr:hypothetical protein MONOS_12359 [Monocercomonoides exilis]|eukprot:MONOS_12359.1-p1 / transcript=MONOS_12359.1 / gene=MONOS_12359 / organism=Monocercomonoides_exilis_PA203 / gene_product=unspecified product / transcript_product=unspecified product / location=Mono_scaffold00680:2659-3723(+) / protein_length=212 / sequence_SO=supercontig / SO=protein_coding / is_pseudo=false